MTSEQIVEAMRKKQSPDSVFEIRFKTRNAIKGMFIQTSDYGELSRKNLWRVVSENYIDEYRKSHDESLARIFNGVEFTRLEAVR